jgi:hypothetical protein
MTAPATSRPPIIASGIAVEPVSTAALLPLRYDGNRFAVQERSFKSCAALATVH